MNNNTEGNNVNNARTQTGKRTETMKGNTQRNVQRGNATKAQAVNKGVQRSNQTSAKKENPKGKHGNRKFFG